MWHFLYAARAGCGPESNQQGFSAQAGQLQLLAIDGDQLDVRAALQAGGCKP
jgi:hypothetical protein